MSTAVSFEVVGFAVGLLFGSFLNVCISRLPEHESVVKPRSRCPGCGHAIRWYDNVPVLSWLLLRRRCRDCKKRISWRYPAVELAVGFWFARVATDLELQWSVNQPETLKVMRALGREPYSLAHRLPELVGIAILGFLLIGLMVMDWRTHRLPDAFTLTGIAIGFVLTCVQAAFLAPGEGDIALNPTHQWRMSSPGSFAARGNVFLTGTEAMVLGRVAAIVGAALILLMIRWAYKAARGHQGMGLGDVKLLAMIAAFLGFSATLVALFVGVMAAMVYALVLLAMRRATAQSKLPFGSFLSVGGLFAAAAGHQIVDWYLGFWR
ncbi:MAG TPA: prepilin peptidase [Acidobacteriaceae bacterium]|nr:prepilin peptidase [Acidobacteriaceae bacterium]